MALLNAKQRDWALYYVETNNAAEAARRAGYAQKHANKQGSKNLHNEAIMELVQQYKQKIIAKSIANAQEIEQFLTSIIRGEQEEEIVVVEFIGDGMSEARKLKKENSTKDKLKAAELMGKRLGMWTETIQFKEPPKIVDDI